MELFGVWFKELRWVQDTLHVRVDTRQGQVSGEPCLPQAL
jgi:hypothetical protein